jgi:hypothetical protein
MNTDALDISAIPDGDLLVECEERLPNEAAIRIREHLESHLPGRKVIVASGGIKITPLDNRETLKRIEQKLDDLLSSRVKGTQRSSPYPVA